jgi:hypothetical protein
MMMEFFGIQKIVCALNAILKEQVENGNLLEINVEIAAFSMV